MRIVRPGMSDRLHNIASEASIFQQQDIRPDGSDIKEFQDIVIPHTDTPDRAWSPELNGIGSPMNIDKPTHGIDISAAIFPPF